MLLGNWLYPLCWVVLHIGVINSIHRCKIMSHAKAVNTDVSMAGLHFRLQRLHAIHSFTSIILLVGEYLIIANGLYDFPVITLYPASDRLVQIPYLYTLCFLEYLVI